MTETERSALRVDLHIRPRASRSRAKPGLRPNRQQAGAIAIMFALIVIVMIAFCGLAVDASRLYNRKVETQSIADAAALAAARKLNGTAAGVADAVAAASSAAALIKFQYGQSTIDWSPLAITFSASPARGGNWVDAGTAAATADRMSYVKVDTRLLDGSGDVELILMQVLSPTRVVSHTGSDAIAGRTAINVAPLAVCAMSTTPAASRTNSASYVELVEYGFRRGVSYDLMNLNPSGSTPANFVVNPVAVPGAVGLAADVLPARVGPYACAGTLGIPRLTGGTISVAQPFPLPSLYKQLNSRFGEYVDNLCTANGAPPDANIRAYVASSMPAVFPWMNTAPSAQTAQASPAAPPLDTIADLPPPGGTAEQYGPVWAYARAVPYSAWLASPNEPTNGYTTFTTASWSTLYGGQTVKTYPGGTSTPYRSGGVNFAAPSAADGPGLRGRRVLNVPLLACETVPGSSATVLAVGKFFMTVQASADKLAAEFAGAMPLKKVDGPVELFR